MTTDSPDPYQTPAEVGEDLTKPAKSMTGLIVAGIIVLVLGGVALGGALMLRPAVQDFGEMRRAEPVPLEKDVTEDASPAPPAFE